ncbi:MAG: hypothetical protein COA62_11865 [Rhodobiaceae bacterium]|nr:MAG: hypothetical protein COA62_11865 [Rhodobiaceae bacterium]
MTRKPGSKKKAFAEHMSTYRYNLRFEGKVSPQDEMGENMGIEATATLGLGSDPAIGAPGASVQFNALVTNDMDGSFTIHGEVVLAGGTLALTSAGSGTMKETPDPTLQQGTLTCQVESGTGSFSGASGTVTLNFTVGEDARFTDLQTGLVFVTD